MPHDNSEGIHFPHIESLHLPQHHKKAEHSSDHKLTHLPGNLNDILYIAEHEARPQTQDYINGLFTDFQELHGDRLYADDRSIIGGLAHFNDRTVMVIGHQRGHTSKERGQRNFGMANPEGIHKTMRLMQHAAKFQFPILTFIDTPGAYPGITAEERGIGQAIAQSLLDMQSLSTPIVTTVIGRGYSGGAMAMGGISDRILMLENSVFATISPEGAAAILWKDASKKLEAAEAMQIGAPYLFKNKIIDEIITEPPGGAHLNPLQTIANVKDALKSMLYELDAFYLDNDGNLDSKRLVANRRFFYRSIGKFLI